MGHPATAVGVRFIGLCRCGIPVRRDVPMASLDGAEVRG
jgi:hypothetical protein